MPIKYYLVLYIYTRFRYSTRKVNNSKAINHGGNYAISNTASSLKRYTTLTHLLIRLLEEERINILRYICNGYVIKTIIISVINSAL